MGIFSMNKVTLVGKLGRDPEHRDTTGGTKVTTFSMATDHSVKKDDKWEQVTTWHKVVLFSLPEFQVQSLRKGSTVLVEGRVSNRSYEKDGETKYISEVVGDKRNFIIFNSSQSNSQSAPQTQETDETPF